MPAKLIECDSADESVREILTDLMQEHRRDLVAHEVSIGLLFALPGKPGETPLKHRGKRAAGTCKVNPYKDRVEGKPDATITLDGVLWPSLSGPRRRALLHHEMEHIDFASSKRDPLGRPALKGRYGDWEFDGFDNVLELYGEDSFEYGNLIRVARRHEQLDLPFSATKAPEGKTLADTLGADVTVKVNGVPIATEAELGAALFPDRAVAASPEPAPDDSWRPVRLDALGLPGKALIALAESRPTPILTVGDVADFTKDGAPLTMVKGIGEAAAEKINAALDAFWAGRKAAEAKADAPPPAGETIEGDRPTGWRKITIAAVVHGKPGADELVKTLLADEYPIADLGDLVDGFNPQKSNFDSMLLGCGLRSEQVDVLAKGLDRLRREHHGEIARVFTDSVIGIDGPPLAPEVPVVAPKPKAKGRKAAAVAQAASA